MVIMLSKLNSILIKSGGGNWPDEARQPVCLHGAKSNRAIVLEDKKRCE